MWGKTYMNGYDHDVHKVPYQDCEVQCTSKRVKALGPDQYGHKMKMC